MQTASGPWDLTAPSQWHQDDGTVRVTGPILPHSHRDRAMERAETRRTCVQSRGDRAEARGPELVDGSAGVVVGCLWRRAGSWERAGLSTEERLLPMRAQMCSPWNPGVGGTL